MKGPLIGWAIGVALSSLLGFTAFRDSSANPHYADYGCVQTTNCYEQ